MHHPTERIISTMAIVTPLDGMRITQWDNQWEQPANKLFKLVIWLLSYAYCMTV